MNHITTLLKTAHIAAASLLVFGLTSAQAAHAVDHSQGYKAMSMKDDLAHRSPDIHWACRLRAGEGRPVLPTTT